MYVLVYIFNFYKTLKRILRECFVIGIYNVSFIVSIYLVFMFLVLVKNENVFELFFFFIIKELFYCKN